MGKLKTISLNDSIDQNIGKIGTKRRDEYEKRLKKELEKELEKDRLKFKNDKSKRR
ncbi:hypothetical protein [Myroides odoratimimus]|uniref:hypothetical protein n=1 Tax=Myroides odoratimimus TaxID=76832 RepID=UPI002577A3C8|nr:hypothetical protein [Myroides odoratimimus]MDM1514354.1 hypothetical protein [Myroides odoratimimus]